MMNRLHDICRSWRFPSSSRPGMMPLVVLVAVVLTLFVAWATWFFIPYTEAELADSDARMVTMTRYVVQIDGQDAFAFSETRGDSLLLGVAAADSSSAFAVDTVDACWTRKWAPIPSARGTLAVRETETSAVCTMSQDSIKALLDREADFAAQMMHIARGQRADLEYFLRTHTVTDNGYDVVGRYDKVVLSDVDSLTKVIDIIDKARKGKSFSIRKEKRYFLIEDSIATPCEYIRTTDSMEVVSAGMRGYASFAAFFMRQPSVSEAFHLLKERNTAGKGSQEEVLDSVGTYEGECDSIGLPHGYGRYQAYSGEFYEGEWEHGKRSGVGFSMAPDKKMRMGEWKDDKFLGNRITHTPDRIYGIDISRHQHEKNGKVFPINWKDLRITSLGTKTRKKIIGEVNYPVQFVYIKVTEGCSILNKYFSSDYASSRKYGYRTGAYHFFSIRTKGSDQAAFFLKHLQYHDGDLPPVLDLEPTDAQIAEAGGIDRLLDNARAWLKLVEKATGVKPIIYVSQNFVNKHLVKAPDLKNGYEVWIARYGEFKPDINLLFWQMCYDGRVNGIHGDVDINVLNGFSLADI